MRKCIGPARVYRLRRRRQERSRSHLAQGTGARESGLMSTQSDSNMEQRTIVAADQAFKSCGAIGPIELLLQLGFLSQSAFDGWQREHEHYRVLAEHIECGAAKLQIVFDTFRRWATEHELDAMPAIYRASSVRESRELKIISTENAALDDFYRTRYRRSDLSPARRQAVEKKVNAAVELCVFIQTSDETICQECGTHLERGQIFCLERQEPLCLDCADLSHLEFLPSGDATLTRRAKKASPLHAVVLQFNRSRKRYERRGLLVSQQSIAEAEESMLQDADKRQSQRQVAAVRRNQADVALVAKMTEVIACLFPSCPAASAKVIAQHTAQRGSGRVGRSAAGREADERAVRLAVIAHIRHEHTNYDDLLMKGVARDEARQMIRMTVDKVASQWECS